MGPLGLSQPQRMVSAVAQAVAIQSVRVERITSRRGKHHDSVAPPLPRAVARRRGARRHSSRPRTRRRSFYDVLGPRCATVPAGGRACAGGIERRGTETATVSPESAMQPVPTHGQRCRPSRTTVQAQLETRRIVEATNARLHEASDLRGVRWLGTQPANLDKVVKLSTTHPCSRQSPCGPRREHGSRTPSPRPCGRRTRSPCTASG